MILLILAVSFLKYFNPPSAFAHGFPRSTGFVCTWNAFSGFKLAVNAPATNFSTAMPVAAARLFTLRSKLGETSTVAFNV